MTDGSSSIDLHIVSPLAETVKKFSASATWGQVQTTLEQLTGIESQLQVVRCQNSTGTMTTVVPEDTNSTLLSWGISDGATVFVSSSDPNCVLNELQATSVEKFVLDDSKYDARPNSVRQWKRKLGIQDTEYSQKFMKDVTRVTMTGKGLGTVKFTGPIAELENRVFVGIEWDSPEGKNDGAVNGHYYFHCKELHGSFVPPTRLEVVNDETYQASGFGASVDEI